jgi:uncharacterized membrane protein YczE
MDTEIEVVEVQYRHRPQVCAICKKKPALQYGDWSKYACYSCIVEYNQKVFRKKLIISTIIAALVGLTISAALFLFYNPIK